MTKKNLIIPSCEAINLLKQINGKDPEIREIDVDKIPMKASGGSAGIGSVTISGCCSCPLL